MIEFALVAGFFIFMILGLLDLSRYLAVKAVITRGAQEALNIAIKADNLQYSPKELRTDPAKLGLFRKTRDEITKAAVRLPLNTIVSESPSSSQEILMVDYDDGLSGGRDNYKPSGKFIKAALIRPGEHVYFRNPNNLTEWIKKTHPTLCSTSDADDECKDPMTASILTKMSTDVSSTAYTKYLRDHPIIIEVKTKVSMFSPYLSDLIVTGRAIGFKERVVTVGGDPSVSSVPASTTTTIVETVTTTPTSTTTTSAVVPATTATTGGPPGVPTTEGTGDTGTTINPGTTPGSTLGPKPEVTLPEMTLPEGSIDFDGLENEGESGHP